MYDEIVYVVVVCWIDEIFWFGDKFGGMCVWWEIVFKFGLGRVFGVEVVIFRGVCCVEVEVDLIDVVWWEDFYGWCCSCRGWWLSNWSLDGSRWCDVLSNGGESFLERGCFWEILVIVSGFFVFEFLE